MKVLLLILSLLPWQNLLQEAKKHYMNYENDSCAVKTARVREYCNAHQGETGVLELSADVKNVLGERLGGSVSVGSVDVNLHLVNGV